MATNETLDSREETFSEAMLGKEFFQSAWLKRWNALSSSRRVGWVSGLFAFLVFVPYLGSVGLWDPWETHYGEVAREMIQRSDYVHPYWENAWFFSKPAFTMWLQALGMNLVGAVTPEGPMGRYTEWGFRLPFVVMSIMAVVLMSIALTRTVNRRAGLAWTFVICTMPTYFLITRQAVTDTPMIAAMISAIACGLVGQLDPQTKHRTAWWYGFYFFCGVGMLAKGLLGVGIPALLWFLYVVFAVLPWTAKDWGEHFEWLRSGSYREAVSSGQKNMPALWAQFYKMRVLTGMGVFFAVALPWYLKMILFEGVDDEGQIFWKRFFIHDHFNRLGGGVHTTTPGGSFTYFIEQGGYGIFPWVLLIPGIFVIASRLKIRSKETADQVGTIALFWAVLTFYLIGSSATKFHHYLLPMLPPIAILLALFIDRLWEEGLVKHSAILLLGAPLFGLVGKDLVSSPKHFTDLFVYNYDRPYPTMLVNRAIAAIGGNPLRISQLIFFAFFAVAGIVFFSILSSKKKEKGASLFLWGSVSASGLLLLMGTEIMRVLANSQARLNVFASNFFRALPILSEPLTVKSWMAFLFLSGAIALLVAVIRRSRTMFFGLGWGLLAVFVVWLNWSHWVDLSHHWTQRDLFWRYYSQRQPGEPIAAFLMNWRGETFYSQNRVKQIKDNSLMGQFASQTGREWALVEHARINILKSAVGAGKTVTIIDKDLNNKFVLVTIDG